MSGGHAAPDAVGYLMLDGEPQALRSHRTTTADRDGPPSSKVSGV
jgi:hypothetical protein